MKARVVPWFKTQHCWVEIKAISALNKFYNISAFSHFPSPCELFFNMLGSLINESGTFNLLIFLKIICHFRERDKSKTKS